MPKACELKPKTLDKYCFYLSLYPPRIPLKKGDAREDSCPPLLRGARGDRTLIVRHQTRTRFDIKLTPFGQGRVPTDLTNSRNDRKTQNCDKHNQGIKLSATALKVFQTFAANQGDKPC